MTTRMMDEALASPVAQLQAIRRLERVWRPHLSLAERDLMAYLLDNSIMWGRRTFSASLSSMADGVKGWITAVGQSRRNIHRTLAALIERGLLAMAPTRNPHQPPTYTVNLEWEPAMARLATPKRLRAAGQASLAGLDEDHQDRCQPVQGRCQSVQDRGQDGHTYKNQEEEPDQSTSLAGSEGSAAVAVAVVTSAAPIPAPPRPRVRPASLGPVRSVSPVPVLPVSPVPPSPVPPSPVSQSPIRSGIIRPLRTAAQAVLDVVGSPAQARAKAQTNDIVWRDAWAQAYPGQAPKLLGKAERGMMAKLRERMEATRKGFDWFGFLTFCIVEWRPIREKYFGWMTKAPPPELPDMRFLCSDKFTGRFMEAYVRRNEMTALDKATGEDRVYLRLTQNGSSHDDAMKQIGFNRANVVHADAHKKALDEAHAQARAFAEDRRRLEEQRRAMAKMAVAKPSPAPVRVPLNHGDNLYVTPHLFAIDDEPFREFEA